MAAGVTVTMLPVKAPGLHVYDDAPVAVKEDEAPLQIMVGEAEAVTVMPGVVVIVIFLIAGQPAAFLPSKV